MPTVWLIEDNPAYNSAITETLLADGAFKDVCAFRRCEDALARMEKGAYPDVILIDVGLPGMDGIEGIGRIHALHEDVCVIVLTVFEDDDKVFRAVCAGARGYLLKSEPVESITVAIEQAIAGGSPMNPRIARRVNDMFAKLVPPREDRGLSDRERTVLGGMVDGMTQRQISLNFDMNPHTVNYVIRCIYKKLHVNCLASAISVAVKEKLVSQ